MTNLKYCIYLLLKYILVRWEKNIDLNIVALAKYKSTMFEPWRDVLKELISVELLMLTLPKKYN